MATRCPKCSTPSVLSAREVGEAGRLVTCSGCGTTWLARHYGGTFYGPEKMSTPAPLTTRDPLIIEGEIVASARPRPAPPSRPHARTPVPAGAARAKARRYGFTAGAAAVVALLIAVVLLAPGVSALPLIGGLFGGAGVVVRGTTTRTIQLRGTEAIFIEGEIVNGTDREVAVPAVRISLQSDGDEVYSWLVEPSVLRVAAGGTVGFRSARASPAPGTDDVALSLSVRRAVGAR